MMSFQRFAFIVILHQKNILMDSQVQQLLTQLGQNTEPNSITPASLANILQTFASRVHYLAETISSLSGSNASSTLPASAQLLASVRTQLNNQIAQLQQTLAVVSNDFSAHAHASTDLSNQEHIKFGKDNVAAGSYAMAVNRDNSAAGHNAFVEGYGNSASGNQSHAEGNQTIASGSQSHAEGWGTRASNNGAHAEGDESVASGKYSHAEGESNESQGDYSHAEGMGNIAVNKAQHVCGMYATRDSSGNLIFQVGIGTDNTHRANAMTIDKQGNIVVHHNPTAAMQVATKGYIDSLIQSLEQRIDFLEQQL